MQIEIKCALEYLLSYLYDKLPRRRVNLFGDELEKYLKLKLITSDSKICLNINFKQNSIELIDPCLIAASKESAMDLKEILECWPASLKLFIESGNVSYSLGQDLNQEDLHNEQVKVIYSEKSQTGLTVTPIASQINGSEGSQFFDMFQTANNGSKVNNLSGIQQCQSRQNFRNNNNNNPFFNQNTTPNDNKSRGLNLNFNNLRPSSNNNGNVNMFNSPTSPCLFSNNVQVGATSPFQQPNDLLSMSSSSSASSSSSSSHLSNQTEDTTLNNNTSQKQQTTSPNGGLPAAPMSNVAILTANSKAAAASIQGNSMFTTAAFAQTKFGSTKSKNNYTRQTKQQKMLPNEFSAYIRNKVRMLSSESGGNAGAGGVGGQIPESSLNLNCDNLIDYLLLNEQVPSISLSSYSCPISPHNQASSFFKNTNGIDTEQQHQHQSGHTAFNNLKFNNNNNENTLIQPELLLTNYNSTVNELEENLINNYFSSTFSSPSSSTVSSASSASSSYNYNPNEVNSSNNNGHRSNTDMNNNNPAINDFLTANNNLLSQINNLTI